MSPFSFGSFPNLYPIVAFLIAWTAFFLGGVLIDLIAGTAFFYFVARKYWGLKNFVGAFLSKFLMNSVFVVSFIVMLLLWFSTKIFLFSFLFAFVASIILHLATGWFSLSYFYKLDFKKLSLLMGGYTILEIILLFGYLASVTLAVPIASDLIQIVVLGSTPPIQYHLLPITCNDSDGGTNYYVKGTVTPYELTDVCVLGGRTQNNTLVEYTCESNDLRKRPYVYYDCPKECKDGACVP